MCLPTLRTLPQVLFFHFFPKDAALGVTEEPQLSLVSLLCSSQNSCEKLENVKHLHPRAA